MSPPLTIQRPQGTYTAPAEARLHAGAARVDITPGLGRSLCGHGPPAFHAQGWLGRLWAAVLVLDDGRGQHCALVTVDLHGGSRYLHEEIARRVAPRTGLTTDRILLLASHTHRGPAYIYASLSYDRVTCTSRVLDDDDWSSHFDKATADAIAQRIADAIVEAWEGRVPARIGVGSGSAWGWLWNRSGRGFDGIQLEGQDPDEFLDKEANQVPALTKAQAFALGRRLNGGDEPPHLSALGRDWVRESFTEAQVAATEDALRTATPEHADDILQALRSLEDAAFERAAEVDEPLEEAVGLPQTPSMAADLIAMSEDWTEHTDLDALALTIEASATGGDEAPAPAVDTLDHLLHEQYDRGGFDGGLWRAAKVILNAVNAADWRRRHERMRWDKWLVDARVQAIYAETLDGTPLALLGLVNATPSLIGGKHAVYCGDTNVMAAQALPRQWKTDPSRGDAPPVVGLGGGALGDVNVVPKHLDIGAIRNDAKHLDQAWDNALRAGRALGRAMVDAADQARRSLRDDARIVVSFADLEAPGAAVETPSGTQRLSELGLFGASTLRGSDLGNSPLISILQEGLFAKEPNHWMRSLPAQDWEAQRPKYAMPRLEHPPTAFPLRLVRFLEADRDEDWLQLVGMPAEVSTMLACQIQEDLTEAASGDPRVLVASVVGEFGGYVGTPWEYLSQSYEASSTLYGRWQGEWSRQQVAALAQQGPTPAPTGTVHFTGRALAKTPLVFIGDPKEDLPNKGYKHPEPRSRLLKRWRRRGKNRGGGFELVDQPLGAMDLVGSWRGDRHGGDSVVWDGPALRLERREDGAWKPTRLAGLTVDDWTVSALVWHEPHRDDEAIWIFRLVLPARPDGLSTDAARDVEQYAMRLAGWLFEDGRPRRLRHDGSLRPISGGVT